MCINKIFRPSVGADLSRTSPIYRPSSLHPIPHYVINSHSEPHPYSEPVLASHHSRSFGTFAS